MPRIASRHGFLLRAALLVVALLFTGCAPYPAKQPEISVEGNRAIVSVPACPDWSSSHNTNYGNGTFSNYGCAHANNLVKMVEDPADLVTPESTGSPDAARNVGVLQQYHESGSSSVSQESGGQPIAGASSGGS